MLYISYTSIKLAKKMKILGPKLGCIYKKGTHYSLSPGISFPVNSCPLSDAMCSEPLTGDPRQGCGNQEGALSAQPCFRLWCISARCSTLTHGTQSPTLLSSQGKRENFMKTKNFLRETKYLLFQGY